MIPPERRIPRALFLVLAAFILLGIIYSSTTPLFEAPDEQWHFAFVRYVAQGKGLPVQSLPLQHLARQEGSQPPLYYLVAAALTFWVNTPDFPEIVWDNPHYGYNVPGIVNDNKNLFIHTSLESFPYQNTALALHLARALSILLGAVAVFFTFRLTQTLLKDTHFSDGTLVPTDDLAVAAAAIVAFTPQFIFISSAVSNDSTIAALTAVALWLLLRLLRSTPRLRDIIILGIVVGSASLAKVSGLALLPFALVVLVWVERKNPKKLIRDVVVLTGSTGLVAGWWYARNLNLYGELTGTTQMLQIFGARTSPLTIQQLWVQLNEVWQTFWLGFGWGNIRAQSTVYDILAIFFIIAAIGLLLALLKRGPMSGLQLGNPAPFLILASWVLVVFISLLRWMMVTQAPHGRLLFPALPAVAPLLVVGWMHWVPGRLQSRAAQLIAVAVSIPAFLAPFLILAPAYAYPQNLTLTDVEKISRRVEITYDDRIKLLAYSVMPHPAQPHDALQLDLYWQALAPMDHDYSINIAALDPETKVIGSRDSYHGHGMLPTRLMSPGQVFHDVYWLPVQTNPLSPTLGYVQVSLYTRKDGNTLSATDPAGNEITPILGRFKILPTHPAVVNPARTVRYQFGDSIALEGYDLQSSGPLRVNLYWRALAPVPLDYTVSLQLLDADGQVIATGDGQPANGMNPTSSWVPREQVFDSHEFKDSTDGGRARAVRVGLYRNETGDRVSIRDAENKDLGNYIVLPIVPP